MPIPLGNNIQTISFGGAQMPDLDQAPSIKRNGNSQSKKEKAHVSAHSATYSGGLSRGWNRTEAIRADTSTASRAVSARISVQIILWS